MFNIPCVNSTCISDTTLRTLSLTSSMIFFLNNLLYQPGWVRQDLIIISCWHPLKAAILPTTLMVHSEKVSLSRGLSAGRRQGLWVGMASCVDGRSGWSCLPQGGHAQDDCQTPGRWCWTCKSSLAAKRYFRFGAAAVGPAPLPEAPCMSLSGNHGML